MVHRTVKIDFSPSSTRQWDIYQQSRKEAARLWNDLLDRHFRIRRANWKWPSKGRWEKWAKGRYPYLHSQSVQQIISEFLEAVEATRRRVQIKKWRTVLLPTQCRRPVAHQHSSGDNSIELAFCLEEVELMENRDNISVGVSR